MEGFGLEEKDFVIQLLKSLKKISVYAFIYIYLEERFMILIRFSCGYLWPEKTPKLG